MPTWKPRRKPEMAVIEIISNNQRKYGFGMRELQFTLPTGTVGKRARQRARRKA